MFSMATRVGVRWTSDCTVQLITGVCSSMATRVCRWTSECIVQSATGVCSSMATREWPREYLYVSSIVFGLWVMATPASAGPQTPRFPGPPLTFPIGLPPIGLPARLRAPTAPGSLSQYGVRIHLVHCCQQVLSVLAINMTGPSPISIPIGIENARTTMSSSTTDHLCIILTIHPPCKRQTHALH